LRFGYDTVAPWQRLPFDGLESRCEALGPLVRKSTVQEANAKRLELSNITVRQLRPDDAGEIALIARSMQTFTQPSPYVVWMLSRTQGGLCQVAVDEGGSILGYLLALIGVEHPEAFVWQLGLTRTRAFPGLSVACELVSAVVAAASSLGLSRIRFTASDEAFNGFIRRVLSDLPIDAKPTGCVAPAGPGPSQPEFEYLVNL
jgi:hypothetical protein